MRLREVPAVNLWGWTWGDDPRMPTVLFRSPEGAMRDGKWAFPTMCGKEVWGPIDAPPDWYEATSPVSRRCPTPGVVLVCMEV